MGRPGSETELEARDTERERAGSGTHRAKYTGETWKRDIQELPPVATAAKPSFDVPADREGPEARCPPVFLLGVRLPRMPPP